MADKGKVKAIYDRLRQHGFNHNAALGVLANMHGESAFDPDAEEKANVKNKGFGLIQWTGPRRKDLEAYFAERPNLDINNPLHQVDYFVWEMQNKPENNPNPEFSIEYLNQKAVSPEAAATVVGTDVEKYKLNDGETYESRSKERVAQFTNAYNDLIASFDGEQQPLIPAANPLPTSTIQPPKQSSHIIEYLKTGGGEGLAEASQADFEAYKQHMQSKAKDLKRQDMFLGGAINQGLSAIGGAFSDEQTQQVFEIGGSVLGATADALTGNWVGAGMNALDATNDIYQATQSKKQGGEQMAEGGPIAPDGIVSGLVNQGMPTPMSETPLTEVQEGGTHEQNPMGGVPIGAGQSVEEGETIAKLPDGSQFVFSNRLTISPSLIRTFGISPKLIGKTFAEASKFYTDKDRPNDIISNRTTKDAYERLSAAQETLKEQQAPAMPMEQMGYGGRLKGAYGFPLDPKIPITPNEEMEMISARGMEQIAPLQLQTEGSQLERPSTVAGPNTTPINETVGNHYGRLTSALPGAYLTARALADDPIRANFGRVDENVRVTGYDVNPAVAGLNASAAGARRGVAEVAGGNSAAAIAGMTGVNRGTAKALSALYGRNAEFLANAENAAEPIRGQRQAQNLEIGMKEADYNWRAQALQEQMLQTGITSASKSISEVSKENLYRDQSNSMYLYDTQGRYQQQIASLKAEYDRLIKTGQLPSTTSYGSWLQSLS